MSIRKLWLMILIFVSIVSVCVNAFILASLTDKYFTDYLIESYSTHVNQIIDYTRNTLIHDDVSYSQMAIELETHLYDPIIGIKLYDPSGNLLVEVEDYNYMMDEMMNGRIMNRMMGSTSNEVKQITITHDEKVIGIMNITIHSIAENSFVARKFKASLLANSSYSILIAIVISIIIGIFVSRQMSNTLQETAKMASDVQFGKVSKSKGTTIKEIHAIRESLMELNTRLKLKQKSRKSLIDQLVHQTRTPLTILKSHIEAMEDGVIEVKDDELSTCKNQVDNITSIISNVSSMIDAEKDVEQVVIETFEFHHLMKQIILGLKAQFDMKDISLDLVSTETVQISTDKYKLSQSIYNILINSYKYTEKKGRVSLSYIVNNGKLSIKIQDTGIGIDKEEQEKIFQAYYRSNRTGQIDGDGIGLFIVKENLKLIDGEIRVSSQVGIGSTFLIEIPIELKKE
ncbi:Signal transduction histidine kinase [Dethiosulfatibacter aminovorans DSM 17477]|uniref:histidine kinase n=1 Tax=Dethiosulfatibacter aminovorans DSM 17477 TaxID=1121476 RepID=A0A1M6MIM5_9FIRM|nr:HAMP domain-containing sensor histidine kinase [Dethiosulfatibacter aminovorans]SHJ83361.1 Signal transduction histidine kinase [Dethiosulfatibacter aminovorans DSM 17477]